MVAYPNAATNVPPPTVFPATIATGVTYDSGVIKSFGANISVWVKSTQALTLTIHQYADLAKAVLVQTTTQAVSANTLTNKVISDGKLFLCFDVTLLNASGSLATLNNAVILQ